MNRRELLRLAAALPAGLTFARLRVLAAPYQGKIKITAIKVGIPG